MFLTTSAYIDFRYRSNGFLTILRPPNLDVWVTYSPDIQRYMVANGAFMPEICVPMDLQGAKSEVPTFPPAPSEPVFQGSHNSMLAPHSLLPKLEDGFKLQNRPHELERYSGHVVPYPPANYCACEDQMLISNGTTSYEKVPQPKLALPRTKPFSKLLLKRLFREVCERPDAAGAIVLKSLKNPPPKIKRKKIQSDSRYIGVSRYKDKWQVLLLVDARRVFLGALESEEEAAILHDQHALLNHGIKKVSLFGSMIYRPGPTFHTQSKISLISLKESSNYSTLKPNH